MGQREPCDDQVHHRRNSLLLNELQHLAKIKLKFRTKGLQILHKQKLKKN